MGVHGLKHLITWHHKSCLSSRSLHGCRLLIDGNNLAYLLYTRAPGICSPLGGDYDKFAAHVAYFFARLQQCDIEATVLMDGGQPRDNVKLHTCTTRLQVTINTCMDLKPSQGGYIRVFPLHARSVFLSVLKRIGVLVIQCDFEADHDLAFLARRYHVKVLSNDSDFFLYNVDYVLLDSLKYHKLKKRADRDGVERWSIPCKMFLKETFLGQCRLQQHHLGLLAALCGNDCVPASYLKEFHEYLNSGRRRKAGHTKRQNLIQLVMAFLARQGVGGTTDVIIEKVVQRVRGEFRSRLRSLVILSASSYRPATSDVEQDVLAGWRIRKKLREERLGGRGAQSMKENTPKSEEEPAVEMEERDLQMHAFAAEGEDGREKMVERRGLTDEKEDMEKDVPKKMKGNETKKKNTERKGCLDEKKIIELTPKEKKQKLGQFVQQKGKTSCEQKETNDCDESNSTPIRSAGVDDDDNLTCECARMWLGLFELPGDDILLKNRVVCDDECHGDEADVGGMEVGSGAESDGEERADRVRLVGDTEEDEEEQEEEDGDELGNEGDDGDVINDICDEREGINDVSCDAADDGTVVVEDEVKKENCSLPNPMQRSPDDSLQVSIDAPVTRNWETMSKKQRKKEMERMKHQERMNRKLNKKAEALENEKISRKEKPSNTFDSTGMDANQIIRAIEMKQKNLLVQEADDFIFDTEENESYPLLSDMTLSSALNELPLALSSDAAGCPHGRSSLVTSFGYRLPAWLMYGYRHCCVTREISDVVTNNFCISPPQVEDIESETSYRAAEKLMKLIVVLARSGGSDHGGGSCDGENINAITATSTINGANEDAFLDYTFKERTAGKHGKRKLDIERESIGGDGGGSDAYDGCSPDRDLTDDMVDMLANNRSFNKSKKHRKRKNDETLRWFIRDGDDLLVEEIVLKETFKEFSHVPSLSFIKNLTRDDRKVVYLRAVFGGVGNSSEILDLPEEFQLVMVFICHWYKNCLSPINEKHVLSVLLSLLMFYVVCGKINRPREAGRGVACVHCILKQCKGYKTAGNIKKLVDGLVCNKDVYHNKKHQRKKVAKANKFHSKRNSHDEMLEVTDDEDWEQQLKSTSVSMNKSVPPPGEGIETKRFTCASELNYLFSTLSEEECSQVDERITGFHNSYNIDNANFDIKFVHSMSEYQACVHYLNLLNGLMMMPFPPVYMERIWSGTFSFNVYKALCRFGDRQDLLVALLLGSDSSLFKIFVHLYSFIRRFLRLHFDVSIVPGMDQNSVIERFLQQSPSSGKKKKKVKQVTKKEMILKKTKEKVEMEVDDHCAVLSLSASSAL